MYPPGPVGFAREVYARCYHDPLGFRVPGTSPRERVSLRSPHPRPWSPGFFSLAEGFCSKEVSQKSEAATAGRNLPYSMTPGALGYLRVPKARPQGHAMGAFLSADCLQPWPAPRRRERLSPMALSTAAWLGPSPSASGFAVYFGQNHGADSGAAPKLDQGDSQSGASWHLRGALSCAIHGRCGCEGG
jgi:hypothetical protein